MNYKFSSIDACKGIFVILFVDMGHYFQISGFENAADVLQQHFQRPVVSAFILSPDQKTTDECRTKLMEHVLEVLKNRFDLSNVTDLHCSPSKLHRVESSCQ